MFPGEARARAQYSALQHLAYSVWLNHDPARCHMAMFTAYFDASGHPDALGKAPALFVSGFVGSVHKWLKFETKWLALLDAHGLTPPFHTTDFEAGKGQYAALRRDGVAAEAFRMAAVDIMARHTNKAFSVGVVIPDLRRLLEEYEVPSELPRHPYSACGLRVCELVVRWMVNRHKAGDVRETDRVKFVFAHGDKHRGEFEKVVKRRFNQVPLFDRNLVPFEACDYLGWEHRNWLTHRAMLRARKPRPSMLLLARRCAFDSSVFMTWRTLSRHADDAGWPKRANP